MNKKLENSWWIYTFLLIGLAYGFGLFIDLTGDSGLYAAISRQMVESGDWFNLKINGQPYDQKPHLFFWLAGLGIQLFGNTNVAFKLFPFLYGSAGIYFTYRLGKQLFSAEAGKFAALITGTSQLFFLYFFDYHTDTVMQTGVVFSLWQLAAYLQTKKIPNFILGFLGVGLAMLSKGPIGAVIPFFAILFFLLVKRDFRQLFHPKWILGIVITALIISPSLLHLYRNFGFDGIKFYFITNNFGRITGDYAGSNTDYFFYLHTLLWAFLPWTIFVAGSFFLEIKSWFQKKVKNEWGFYLLGSVLVLLVILSIAKGKAPNYVLIAISPIAVVVADKLTRFHFLSGIQQQRYLMFHITFILLFAALTAWFILVIAGLQTAGFFTLVLTIVMALLFYSKRQNALFFKTIFATLILTGLINVFFNGKVLPRLFAYQGPRQVLKIFGEKGAEESSLYNLDIEEYALFFYAEKPVKNIENWNELKIAFAKPGTWVYTNETDYQVMLFQKFPIDTVYTVQQRGMNRINMKFINPKTRNESLVTNYLVVSGEKKSE